MKYELSQISRSSIVIFEGVLIGTISWIIGSFLPGMNAARLTVREILAYE